MKARGLVVLVSLLIAPGLLVGCGTSHERRNEFDAHASRSAGVGSLPVPSMAGDRCRKAIVAIDPGHNPDTVREFDPVTGVAQVDYPNGAEDQDNFIVASIVQASIERRGYRVVLVKRQIDESVTYRERVRRAESAQAVIGVSIHTSPGVNSVFPQRVGLYREGVGADGHRLRVAFSNSIIASRSISYSSAIARARSEVQGVPVIVTDNDFAGRAPLWEGNIPIISLISDKIPWVYSEFSADGGGGSIALSRTALRTYADGLIKGIESAIPVTSGGCIR